MKDEGKGRRIVPVEDEHILACEAFIAPRERSCAYLSERLIDFKNEKRANAAHSAPELFMLTEGEKAHGCCGILFASRGGKVLHCLSRRVLKSLEWQDELASFFKKRNVASIAGEREANRFLERICGRSSFCKTDYIFMQRLRGGSGGAIGKINPSALAIKDAFICACSIKDADELLPLQMAYEAEEIGGRGEEIDGAKALMRLKGILRRETVIACRDARTGRLLGKAGTNAKGMRWNQIGGVYTLPSERGKGIAGFMALELARISAVEGKDAVLFVRPKNKAARRAYEKAGFRGCGRFRVANRL